VGAVLRRNGAAAGAVAVALLGVAAGCGTPSVTVPPAPAEVQSIAAEYDNPTGTVPVSAMQQIEELQQTLETINSTNIGAIVSNSLVNLRKQLAANGLALDPVTTPKRHHPVIVAVITANRTCRGWDDASTTPNAADGTFDLTATYQHSMLQRTIFGTATACHDRITVTDDMMAHVFFDGSVGVFLEGPLMSDPTQAEFLMTFSGTIGTEATQAPADFDFRVIPPQVEVRIAVADGSVIGSFGTNEVTLRGKNGTYGCSLVTFTCALPQTVPGQTAPGAAPPAP
jgi:hypothetical protein